jgi:putative ABC transport system permease protein
VIGYRDWMERYRGDPDVVGRTMQIGREAHTIVGVMPEEYGFPLAALRWLPFRDDPDGFAVMETPHNYFAFGRLAPGVTIEAAQAELAAIGSRRAAELPDSHEQVRAIVMSYTDTHTGMDNAGGTFIVRITLAVLTMLVLVPFVNVATLVYARTATRAGELSIRSALGASRRRIVSQLFVEALVLASLSAVVGLGLVWYGFDVVDAITAGIGDGGGMPFWATRGRDPWVAAYVVGLTLLAAVVAGVVPGLKATGRGVQTRLNRAASGNGMRLGRAWTTLIVLQVATTVGFLPFAASMGWQILGMGLTRPTFEAESMVAGHLSGPPSVVGAEAVAYPDPTGRRAAARVRARLAVEEVIRRVEADGRVADVTLSSEVPGTLFGSSRFFDVEGVEPPQDVPGHRAGEMRVAEDFFEAIRVRASVGRLLHATDVEAESPPVVVNRAFVDEILGGANALGRHVRYTTGPDAEPAPWREIVGVVEDLVLNPTHPDRVEPQLYAPLDRAEAVRGVFLVVRVPGETRAFVAELRRITTAVDPTLALGTVTPLGDLGGVLNSMIGAGALAFAIVFVAGLMLCAAGVFALMSFSVTQRHREIGVRSALGAHPRRVLGAVLGRSLRQVLLGVVVGVLVVWAIPPINADGIIINATAGPIAFVALLMVGVGMLAAIGPARRGLRIHPTDALREV